MSNSRFECDRCGERCPLVDDNTKNGWQCSCGRTSIYFGYGEVVHMPDALRELQPDFGTQKQPATLHQITTQTLQVSNTLKEESNEPR